MPDAARELFAAVLGAGEIGGGGEDGPAEHRTEVITAKPPVSIYDVIAARAVRLARFTDRAPGLARAIKWLARAGDSYALATGSAPEDLIYEQPRSYRTPDGFIFMVSVRRK